MREATWSVPASLHGKEDIIILFFMPESSRRIISKCECAVLTAILQTAR